jgi:hypothetical protein
MSSTVARISLYNKASVPADLTSDVDVVFVEPNFCMGDNNTAYSVRWMFEGWERPDLPWPDPPGIKYPYSAQIIKTTWHESSGTSTCVNSVFGVISNFSSFVGVTAALMDFVGIHHVKYGTNDFIAIAFTVRHWKPYTDPNPLTWPFYGMRVLTFPITGGGGLDVTLNLPTDDNTNNLSIQIPATKASIWHGKICMAVDLFEHSFPPPGWKFPDDGPCPATGDPYCPSPVLIIDVGSAVWAADVTVVCAGWNGGGYKEYNVDEFHSLGPSCCSPVNKTFYYTAQRLDYETILVEVSNLHATPLQAITARGYMVAELYNGKVDGYAINSGTGEVYRLYGGFPIATVPLGDWGGSIHAFDDKNDMFWTVTEAGIIGNSIVDPLKDRTITVEWPIDPAPAPPVPYLFRWSDGHKLAMRILAGEIVVYVSSNDPGSGALQRDILILKENLPFGYTNEYPPPP